MKIQPAVLKTDRLLLRPFEWDDIEDFYVINNDEVFRGQLDEPFPYSQQDAENELAWVLGRKWESSPHFALVKDNVVIGSSDLNVGRGGLGETRPGVADLSYYLARPHWGNGLVPEACQAIIAYGFKAFDLTKITACTLSENRQSYRVMEKLAMTREGLLRQHGVKRDGQRADQVVYGLLRQEWDSAQRSTD